MALIDKDDYEDMSVFDKLVMRISKMTDVEQEKLLEALEKRQPEEREQRIGLYTETNYTVDGVEYTGVVSDLSSGGLFMETGESFATGQEISVKMKRSKDAKVIKIRGRIARIEPNGFGVQFYK